MSLRVGRSGAECREVDLEIPEARTDRILWFRTPHRPRQSGNQLELTLLHGCHPQVHERKTAREGAAQPTSIPTRGIAHDRLGTPQPEKTGDGIVDPLGSLL